MIAAASDALEIIVKALFTYNYIEATTKATDLIGIVGYIIDSQQQVEFIANATKLSPLSVNHTLTALFSCLNTTALIHPHTPADSWKCLGFSNSSDTGSNAAKPNCASLQSNLNLLILGSLSLVAIAFLIVMSALQRRSSYKLHYLNGRPGLVVPLNLLDGYKNRFAYSLAFGVTTSYCISIIFYDSQSVLGEKIGKIIISSPSFVGIFFKMLATIVLATGAYPLFVCIGTKHKVYGSLFGLLFCITWFSLFCYKTSVLFRICYSKFKELLAFDLIMEMPQYACLILLMLNFLRMIFLALRGRLQCDNESDRMDMAKNKHMFHHVRNLFKGNPVEQKTPSDVSFKQTIKAKLKKYTYQWRKEFKYSTRVMCTFVVCFLAIYMLTVYLIEVAWILLDNNLVAWVGSKSFNESIGPALNYNERLMHKVQAHVQIWTSCCYLAIVLSTVKTWLVFLNMLTWYREHLLRLRRGDHTWLPKSIQIMSDSPASLTAASMKYAGFQVAYAAWGYWIFAIVLWIVLGIIASFIVYPIAVGESSFLLRFIYKIWPALVITLALYFAQWLTSKYCFLLQRGRAIGINNRKAFNITSYYLFFFNIFLGIISCLLRIFKSMFVGVIFLERVQKSVLPSSFERIDPGYYAYMGYILLEHTHANPVLNVFFYLLSEEVKRKHNCSLRSIAAVENDDNIASNLRQYDYHEKTFDSFLEQQLHAEVRDERRSRTIKNRWQVLYTLIKNPTLVKFRKGQRADNEERRNSFERSNIEGVQGEMADCTI